MRRVGIPADDTSPWRWCALTPSPTPATRERGVGVAAHLNSALAAPSPKLWEKGAGVGVICALFEIAFEGSFTFEGLKDGSPPARKQGNHETATRREIRNDYLSAFR